MNLKIICTDFMSRVFESKLLMFIDVDSVIEIKIGVPKIKYNGMVMVHNGACTEIF